MNKSMTRRDAILRTARAIDDTSERAEYVNQACGSDETLRHEVKVALRDESPNDTSSARVGDVESTVDRPASLDRTSAPSPSPASGSRPAALPDGPGSVIGHYKLLQLIGEGGMGAVYMAEQLEPVRRKVALKIIKPGMDSKGVLARFEAERQALAMMEHHHIARVLDAGTTNLGRPYFVMELVRGVPITDYCESNKLTVGERLELFLPICQAIQHAHQKGIIHRDIKPSNVLVTMHDGRPVPTVIDFGVAKAIGQQLTERTMFTQYGQVIGTLEYMSPEQSKMSGLDVDTRSDIYSLGVLLYELLTGTTPLRHERVKTAPLDEVMRAIREEDAEKPSTRLSDSVQTATTMAVARDGRLRKLSTLLRGDLDWIVMKTLEKDRTRRYETASALAADVRRYLNDEPVEAGPPSTTYRLQKLFRRHRAAITTAAAFVLLLVLGVVLAGWQAVRATLAQREADRLRRETEQVLVRVEEERNRAVEAEGDAQRSAQAALLAQQQAEMEKRIAQAVNHFINDDILFQANPFSTSASDTAGDDRQRADQISLRTVVDRAASTVGTRFPDQPLVEAGIRLTLGSTYLSLGEYAAATEHLTRGFDLRYAALGAADPATLEASNVVAELYIRTQDFVRAEPRCQEILRLGEPLGETHPVNLEATANLAEVYRQQRRYEDAETLLLKLLDLCRNSLGEDDPLTLTAMNALGNTYSQLNQFDKAEQLLTEVLRRRRRVLGETHPSTLMIRMNLGMYYGELKRYAEAEAEVSAALKHLPDLLGQSHPTVRSVERNLAWWRMTQANYEAVRQQLTARIEVDGEEEQNTLLLMQITALAALAVDQPDEALRWSERSLEIARRVYGEQSDFTIYLVERTVSLIGLVGDWERALPLARQVAEYRKSRDDYTQPATLEAIRSVMKFLIRLNQFREAEQMANECLGICSKELGDDHPQTIRSLHLVANCKYGQGDLAEAGTLALQALEREKNLPVDHPFRGRAGELLVDIHIGQGEYQKAEAIILDRLADSSRRGRPVGWVRAKLGLCQARQGNLDEADSSLRQALREVRSDPDHTLRSRERQMAEFLEEFPKCFEQAGRSDQAEYWRQQLSELRGKVAPGVDADPS